ncbi:MULTISPECIES: HAD-IC family P-type ATPase [Streptomyces]|uniref:HAD-IC family P-type ATPase n=1 Tax=Streptomyces TaxID=1883 RepID=UPI001CCCAE44|nr:MULTISPECIES: HAD-IC family P-type ATPase [Streptomyces]UBI36860.1 HAD-IC family P-type ATPase [Streptomyces mobaraensis]UKW29452.1 HAD-IC family P-type ATPase [Streptomyces sp. TYQ1024]
MAWAPEVGQAGSTLHALRELGSGPRGLTEDEAARRLADAGENVLPGRRPPGPVRRFAHGLRDPFTAVLLCLGLVSAAVASWGTACVISVLVAVSCALRTVGEHRAERAAAALRDLVPTTATVRRRPAPDAPPAHRELPVGELVPGDVVLLSPGDLVPADLRLLRTTGLTVHEAVLTGESTPAEKRARDLAAGALRPVSTAAYAGDVGGPAAAGAADDPVDGTDDRDRTGGPAGRSRLPGRTPAERTPLPHTALEGAADGLRTTPSPARRLTLVPADGASTPADDDGAALHRHGPHRPAPGPEYADGRRTSGPGGAYDDPDPAHLCFQGSSVLSGTATGVVVATGAATRLSGALPGAAAGRGGRRVTPFDRSVNGIAWTLIRFMLLTAPLVLVASALLRGRGMETLPFAVAVAVGLTPEMLPVVVTAALARGAAGLARGGEVIVRRLPALHDLGAVDVLCVDKTGTLTQDRPVLHHAEDGHGRDGEEVLRWAAVNALWTLHLAELPLPDALDEAVLDAAGDDALLAAEEEYEGIAALPCAPGRPLSTAVVRRADEPRFGLAGVHVLVVKGAPEDVLERCALEPAERDRLARRAADLAADGLRVLAVARAGRPSRHRPYGPADEHGLEFTGFLALHDALTPTAAEALAVLADRGIAVRVLTGDHPGTAARVCRDLGLDPGEVVTADRVDGLTDAELAALAGRTTVFARCSPDHKARIVRALRANGRTTGFLGDGVNDLAALHAADVGVCPRAGVDVAREAADVVLASKDLTALDRAVTAGRRSTGNIAAYLRITLSSNFGNVIAMLAAGLLLPFLPMLPAQVLVQNLFFDAAQLALAFDRPAPAALRRPTRLRPRDLLRFVTVFGLLNAAADLATFGVLAFAVRSLGDDGGQEAFHAGWFTENLLTQALVMLVLRSGRHLAEGRPPGPVRLATTALAVVGLLLPLSPLGPLLAMTGLPPLSYVLLATVLTVYGAALTVARNRYARRVGG